MHACRAGEKAWWADPVPRNLSFVLHRRRRIAAREVTDHVAGSVRDLQRDRTGGGRLQPVIDDGAVRRILSGRLVRRERSIRIRVPSPAPGLLWPEESACRIG